MTPRGPPRGAPLRPTLRRGRTRALANTAQVITGEFVRHPQQAFPQPALQQSLRDAVGEDAVEFVDATRLATRLLGTPMAANILMLGLAWQRGLVPVSRAALMRAIELTAVAVADNQSAFEWGRRVACDPQGVERLAARAGPPTARPLSQGLAELVARRREVLADYQDERTARRYEQLVEQVRLVEADAVPGSDRLATAVARNAFRLLACKDEYEVARLHAHPKFRHALAATFEGDFRIHLHLAPSWLARRDAVTGEGRKRSFGPWALTALRLLAPLKALRGTPYDVFGATAERRLERALVKDYLHTVRRLIAHLHAGNHALACEIADLPDTIRGFGPVRQRHADAARARQAELMATWLAEAASGGQNPATSPSRRGSLAHT